MLLNNINKVYRPVMLLRYTSTINETKSIQAPSPNKISSDMIGPPDPVSNLRKIIFKKPKDETNLERKYRILRNEVQEWNQNFWTQHNSRFFKVVLCNHILFFSHPKV